MNKQELIEEIEDLKDLNQLFGNNPGYIKIDTVMGVVSKLDEPQKPVVPQFVADWYEANKDDFEGNLFRCIDRMPDLFSGEELSDFEEWIVDGHTKPFQILVNMHQFGYTVEKEPKYTVKIKEKIGENLLVYGWGMKRYFFARTYNDSSKRGEHTRKELEEDGFGWVFDCPGIEIKEVTE